MFDRLPHPEDEMGDIGPSGRRRTFSLSNLERFPVESRAGRGISNYVGRSSRMNYVLCFDAENWFSGAAYELENLQVGPAALPSGWIKV